MKKLLFVVLTVFAFVSFAAVDAEKIIKWNNYSQEQITALEQYSGKKKPTNGFKICMQIEKAGKANPKVFTDYATYKSTFNEIIKGYAEGSYFSYAFVQIPFSSTNFKDGAVVRAIYLEFKDAEAQPASNAFYVQRYCINTTPYTYIKTIVNPNEFIQWYFFKNNKDYQTMELAVRYIQKNIIQMQDAKTIVILKKMKKVAYAHISESDNWKQLTVKIELMIKSLE